ncbi:MAG TPA: multiheme c-type cytochrome [Acidobacteriaceae bacterium]
MRRLHRRRPDEPVARWGLGAILVVLAIVAGIGSLPAKAQLHASQSRTQATANPRAQQDANADYVGSYACSRCHIEIYNHYAQTKMGGSAQPVTADFLKTVPLPADVYDQRTSRRFRVYQHEGKLYQSEYQLDASGNRVFDDTHAIDYIVGAGMNGLSGLVHRDGYLFEAPLSFYKETGQWALSPGYQRGDYGFSRMIASGCIYCHTGRSQPIAGREGKYAEPAFTQLSVGCENCHGPGQKHIDAMESGANYKKGNDPTIVNPASLRSGQANDLCESCHQTGDVRLYQPGKSYQDFRPGMRLDRIIAILMIPPSATAPPSDDHVEHYYSMTLSKCYLATAAKPETQRLRCISCHDPHVEPTSAEAPAYFNGKCMNCHTTQSCKAPSTTRRTSADNCIGCHMPTRQETSISHTSLTNHRIVARPGEPYPAKAFQMTTTSLPDLIYLNDSTGSASSLSPVSRLKAYQQLREQNASYEASYQKTLRELSVSMPGDATVQAALGHEAVKRQQWSEASDHLQHALKAGPDQSSVYADLSTVADAEGNAAEALAWQQKAVSIAPHNEALNKALILRLIDAKEYAEAEADMKRYVEEFPEDDGMRRMLAIAESQ